MTIFWLVKLAMMLCTGAVPCSTDDATCNVPSDATVLLHIDKHRLTLHRDRKLEDSRMDGDLHLDVHLNAATRKSGELSQAKVQADSDGYDFASMLQSRLETVSLSSAKQADLLVDSPYRLGPLGGNSCPTGTIAVASEENCMQATLALEGTFVQSIIDMDIDIELYPKGCFMFTDRSIDRDTDRRVNENRSFFNPHDTGQGAPGFWPICQEVHCQSESDCHNGDPGYTCGVDNLCQTNVCTCVDGLAATGPACTSQGGVICKSCDLGFILEGGACEASMYNLGLINSSSCPVGFAPIASEGDCMEAASFFHIIYRELPADYQVDFPKGCFYHDFTDTGAPKHDAISVQFNPHDTGSSEKRSTPLCQVACSNFHGVCNDGEHNLGGEDACRGGECDKENCCEANTCICSGGDPVHGSACTTNHEEFCASCYDGFHLIGHACLANECTCVDGLAATGPACTSNGGAICEFCNPGFILEGGACEASPYRLSPLGGNSCPTGAIAVASEENCMQATPALEGTFAQTINIDMELYPKGCFMFPQSYLDETGARMHENFTFFNPHDTGHGSPGLTPICQEMPCQSESDCPHGGTGYTCMDSLCQATCASFSVSSCLSNSLVDNAASTVCTDGSCSSPANDNLCCKATCGSYDCAQNGFVSMDDPDSIVCTDSTCSRPANDHVCCKATCSGYDTSQCAQNGLLGVGDPNGTICTDSICSSPANDIVCCKACYKPKGCTGLLDEYLNVDCDGDGLLDHMCTYGSTGDMRLVLTTEGCPQIHPDGGGSWGPMRQASECCVWVEHEGVEAVSSSIADTTKFDFEDAKARCLERGQLWCKAVTCETIPLPPHMGGGTTCTMRTTTTMVIASSSSWVKTYVPTAGCFP